MEEEATTIQFADTTSIYQKHSIKISVKVQNWPFRSLRNVLSIDMESLSSNSDSSVCNSESSDENLRWILLSVGEYSLYPFFHML